MNLENYKENPKTKGSGILCAIPQKGECPQHCADCFFQSGRSFLEPLKENLPNMPEFQDAIGRVIRINDGNDSNHMRDLVINSTKKYPMKFYNTSFPMIEDFDAPVVLTLNPARMTDKNFHKLLKPFPKNLMFVRVRVNVWNIETVVIPAIKYYTEGVDKIPVILTFMAYFDQEVPDPYKDYYIFKKRTLNAYWVIRSETWKGIMDQFWKNPYVYSCSKIEGELGSRACSRCGNCLREYFTTAERMKG